MQISLKEWYEINKAIDKARKAKRELSEKLMSLQKQYQDVQSESNFLLMMASQVADGKLPSETQPQSEWTGGNSDDPRNHKLREPHCVGLNRRYFTEEEMIEARVVNRGPCNWEYLSETP